ncbi:MAG TPA: aminopeptidase P family N-terminal domain-containing protein, partial [Alphaproteobacteria bacterium]|nr:aminopeptidase P family N-terminal domain-containing protein [Alphaproteobacteria bacterium]
MAIAATTDEARLNTLLRAAGSPYDASALEPLLAGIAAAAPRDEGWMRLIAPAPSDELKEALRGLYRHATEASEGRDSGGDSGARLAALRAELARRGLDGFLVPLADEHQGEYIPGSARRLAWLTGFSGSAGLAAVLMDKAAIFVDGRYTLQAERQVDGALYERRHLTEEPAPDWLAERLKGGERLGFDPWLHTKSQAERLRRACKQAGAELIALPSNPLDAVWPARPPKPIAPIVPHPLDYAGKPSAEKRAEIGAALARAKADAAFLSAPDSIAWLLNVRGGDVACTPLPLSFALVFADAGLEWFVDRRKLTSDLESWLGSDIALAEPEALGERLDALKGKTVRLDPASAPYWAFERLEQAGAEIAEGDDPSALPK